MDVAFVENFASYGFSCSAFKEDVVRHHYGCFAVDFQQCFDVLEEVELFVACCCPEILAFIG